LFGLIRSKFANIVFLEVWIEFLLYVLVLVLEKDMIKVIRVDSMTEYQYININNIAKQTGAYFHQLLVF
jgi:hypothetical protein